METVGGHSGVFQAAGEFFGEQDVGVLGGIVDVAGEPAVRGVDFVEVEGGQAVEFGRYDDYSAWGRAF